MQFSKNRACHSIDRNAGHHIAIRAQQEDMIGQVCPPSPGHSFRCTMSTSPDGCSDDPSATIMIVFGLIDERGGVGYRHHTGVAGAHHKRKAIAQNIVEQHDSARRAARPAAEGKAARHRVFLASASIRHEKTLNKARRRLEPHLGDIVARRRIEAEQAESMPCTKNASARLRGAMTRPMRKRHLDHRPDMVAPLDLIGVEQMRAEFAAYAPPPVSTRGCRRSRKPLFIPCPAKGGREMRGVASKEDTAL